MKSISISGSVRKESGTKYAKLLRKDGMVPCVVYGAGDPLHVAIDERKFKNLVFTPNVYQVKLDIDGTEHLVFLKDVQFHPVTDRVIHADFFKPKEGEKVEFKIPVQLVGTPLGVLNGGRLLLIQRRMKVRGAVADLPDAIEIEISKLRIGQGIRVNQLKVNGLEFLDNANNFVVAVKTARGAIEDEEEEEEEGETEGAEAATDGDAAAESSDSKE